VVETASPTEAYFKKTITVRLQRRQLELDVAQDLFSGHELDAGSRLLLRSLATPKHEPRSSVLDLGCGYGPIGLGLKLLNPARAVDMVDRDALALDFSRRNAARNGMSDVEVYASLGWSDVRRSDYDLVVSNVPAKAGEGAIRHFLLDAAGHLRPGGMVAVVVIARLDELVRELLVPDAGVELTYEQRAAGYSVYHYQPVRASLPEPSSQGKGEHPDEDALSVYERGRLDLTFGQIRYRVRTAYSLPEFDTLGYHTRLMADQLLTGRRRPGEVLVFNPGQGHLPVLIGKALVPERITLAGRDLLALAYSRDNLTRNEYPADRVRVLHRTAVQPADVDGVDLVVATLKDGQPNAITELELHGALERLRPRGRLIAGGSSTAVTRLEASVAGGGGPLRVIARKRNRRHSVLELGN
jgi:16S rRNA G1207 methylase RsmC